MGVGAGLLNFSVLLDALLPYTGVSFSIIYGLSVVGGPKVTGVFRPQLALLTTP